MKYLLKLISPLLLSGLILPLTQHRDFQIYMFAKTQAEIMTVKDSACKMKAKGFYFFNDVVINILPALKNMN